MSECPLTQEWYPVPIGQTGRWRVTTTPESPRDKEGEICVVDNEDLARAIAACPDMMWLCMLGERLLEVNQESPEWDNLCKASLYRQDRALRMIRGNRQEEAERE